MNPDIVRILVVQDNDGHNYVSAYKDAESFITHYDAYSQINEPALTERYEEAVQQALLDPEVPQDLGNGVTITLTILK